MSVVSTVRQIRALMLQQDAYVDSLPADIRVFVFDNAYCDLKDRQNSILAEALFGDLYEDIAWFLYEYVPGSTGPHAQLADGSEFTFHTDEDYYTYLEEIVNERNSIDA